jgi:hypothetical protein
MLSLDSRPEEERERDADDAVNLGSLASAPNLRPLQLAGAFVSFSTSNSNGSKLSKAIRDEESVLEHLLARSPSDTTQLGWRRFACAIWDYRTRVISLW